MACQLNVTYLLNKTFNRGRGLKAIIYINDGIITVKGEDNAKRESLMVRSDLESAGFVVNIEKSQWEPSKFLEWLGFRIDLALGVFSVPDRKIEELQALLRYMSDRRVVPACQFTWKNCINVPCFGYSHTFDDP